MARRSPATATAPLDTCHKTGARHVRCARNSARHPAALGVVYALEAARVLHEAGAPGAWSVIDFQERSPESRDRSPRSVRGRGAAACRTRARLP